MLLLIDAEIRDGIVRYLGTRPYGEVVHAIAALQQLPPVPQQDDDDRDVAAATQQPPGD